MISRILVAILVVLPSLAVARPSSQSDLRALIGAKSIGELDARMAATALQNRVQEACGSELRARAVPRSCFKKPMTVSSLERERLTQLCRDNAMRSRSRLDLTADSSDLPTECRAAIATRLADLDYVDEEARPDVSVIRTRGPEFE